VVEDASKITVTTFSGKEYTGKMKGNRVGSSKLFNNI